MSRAGAEQSRSRIRSFRGRAPPRPDVQGSRGLWRYGDLLPVSELEAVTLGEGGTPLHNLATLGRSVGRGGPFRQGRDPQSNLVVQGSSGLHRGFDGANDECTSRRVQLDRQCRCGCCSLCCQSRIALHRLYGQRRGWAFGHADAGLWCHRDRGCQQGGPLAIDAACGTRIRMVSHLALFRAGGREQSLRRRRLQDLGL